jgi:GNAT superfamily N-acetyltransferase
VDARDIEALAALHVASIPDSLITVLGERYARTCYEYFDRSPAELVLVDRDAAGTIVAAAVVSLEPETLNRRLVRHTALLASMCARAPQVLSLLWTSARRPRGAAPSPARAVPIAAPELILMFTAASMRSRGVGASLLRSVDETLRQHGIATYIVHTVSDPANRAIAFYRANGFEPSGMSYRLGTAFVTLTRTVPA